MTRDDLLDLLSDLQHDLGKHARMSIALLPADVPLAQLQVAVQQALLHTRHGPTGSRSAAQLWQDFVAAAGTEWRVYDHAPVLETAVLRALAWRDVPVVALHRQNIEADLLAVAQAIRALRQEVEHGG